MNILADENIAVQVVERLRQDGHNVRYTIQGQGVADTIVLDMAYEQKALLITDDKDFGELVIRNKQQAFGVLLVRLPGFSFDQKAEIVANVVSEYGDALITAFTVITAKNIRSRPLNS